MKTIASILVPVYTERDFGAVLQTKLGRELRKLRILFARRRHLQPFWTWFIDNPKPSELHQL
jgi:hypothetical protein